MKSRTSGSLIVLAVFLSLWTSSPVSAQSYSKDSFVAFFDNAATGNDKATKQFDWDKNTFEGCLSLTTTPHAPAYHRMEKNLYSMRPYLKSVQEIWGKIAAKRDEVDQLFAGVGSIPPNDPRAGEAQDLMDWLQHASKKVYQQHEYFNGINDQFIQIVHENGITAYSADDLRNKVQNGIGDHWSRVSSMRDRLKRTRDTASQKPSEAGDMERAGQIAGKVEAAWVEYKLAANQFKDSIPKRPTLYTGPGIQRMDIPASVAAQGAALRDWDEEFKSLCEKIKNAPAGPKSEKPAPSKNKKH